MLSRIGNLSRKYTTFVSSDISAYKLIDRHFNEKNTIKCQVDDVEINKLFNLREGTKLIQWYRLKIALNSLLKFEDNHSIKFDYIVKLRTDCRYGENLEDSINKIEISNSEVLMHSDLAFAFSRRAIEVLIKFYDNSCMGCYSPAIKAHELNLNLLAKSDPECFKLTWMSLPKLKNHTKYKTDVLRYINELINYKEKFDGYVNELSESVWFSSEAAFATCLNTNGFLIRALPFKVYLMKNRSFGPDHYINQTVKKLISLKINEAFITINSGFQAYPNSKKIKLFKIILGMLK